MRRALLTVLAFGAVAAPAQGAVRLEKVGDFEAPVYVTAPPGDTARVFVVEQGGTIRIVGRQAPFLDISSQVTSGGEQGLLSMAFAPDYATSGLFYVYFTDADGDQQVVEFRGSGDAADPRTARQVLLMRDSESNHNGGQLQFGPDGRLYIGTGDGGGAGDARNRAQNRRSLLGKLLRMDPTRGGRPEIYAYGLRNPWRFSFDRQTGDLTIGDVGQGEWEEINFVRRGRGKGANFGWRPFEGNARFAPGESAKGHVRPVITQSHEAGNCSITGGYVIRDPALSWRGRYVFGDYCRGVIQTARLGGVKKVRVTHHRALRVESLSSFGEDASGRVYAASLNGPVYRFVDR
ncbi:PQQ-dependent sugar dehydrogenase [Solirubrobacter sp. CPCC 204708]|uniref:PQQ-dependent sugar dehydrogenase n=1 Tax=Solirubrobacter deserti TaxID=2282478 RepID=A0ABT4RFW1_9ACTN|nr:PQQ-dependent sugar dehydrogenase [Solirubrobacter deserti]MBE2318090.1 PQQ-dependent sugar dehydrogenase [Solirubrobacter deserti]MDA0137368.1 PQQ-dependent sugar dehydrogenase [Solirubrobacter deserti]